MEDRCQDKARWREELRARALEHLAVLAAAYNSGTAFDRVKGMKTAELAWTESWLFKARKQMGLH